MKHVFTFFALMMSVCLQIYTSEDHNLATFFEGYTGTLVMENLQTGERTVFNEERASKRISPCSTYKVPHALIGLETGELSGINHEMELEEEAYVMVRGNKFSPKSWNRDQTLKSAIQNSVLWYFQKLAKIIGKNRMQDYIDLIEYGNQDISGPLTEFWLADSLLISANEQLEFVKQLAQNELPFSQRSMEIVKECMIYQETDKFILRGKTGSGFNRDIMWGWYVGYLQRGEDLYAFAANIEHPENAMGGKVREIVIKILQAKNLMQ